MIALHDTEEAKILRKEYPSFSYCGGCGLPWNYCKSKTVMTSKREGTFATCVDCWNTLSLEELKICYAVTYGHQYGQMIMSGHDDMEHTLVELLNCVEEEYKIKKS